MTLLEPIVDAADAVGISEADLEALALAADPDAPLAPDARPLGEVLHDAGADDDGGELLPSWYMPTPMRRSLLVHGWKRWLIFALIVVFVLIDAYGLCFTYGHIELA